MKRISQKKLTKRIYAILKEDYEKNNKKINYIESKFNKFGQWFIDEDGNEVLWYQRKIFDSAVTMYYTIQRNIKNNENNIVNRYLNENEYCIINKVRIYKNR
ncbi:MAG: hypothetical protein LBF04_02260 [Prevotellaceae bacterium]|jgi:uncharacterized protein (DUF2147 family)|nr:hypothetical protein [Prevotellaceae bacterium]